MSDQFQPIFVVPGGTTRDSGKKAQKNNIAAAKIISDTIRTTLGPKGMDKMLVDSTGDVIITNDGVTILDEMEIEHPAAKMIVEVAKVQEAEVGDGTTTAVVLAGELLHAAESMLDKNIHSTIIADGYKLAAKKTKEILKTLNEKVDIKDKTLLKNIAMTAMTGKNVEWAKEKLAKISVDAVNHVAQGNSVDIDNIKIEKKEGGGSTDTELIEGILLDKEKLHENMPDKIKGARVALIDSAIEVKTSDVDTKIQITNPSQLEAFMDKEEKVLKKFVESIKKSGANTVFCSKGVDDVAQHLFAEEGIYAVRRITKSDMNKLAKATSGKIISDINSIKKSYLGKAGVVEQKKLGGEKMTYVTECKNPKAVTIIVRGGTEHVVDEVERAVTDAIGDLGAAVKNGKCVAGGGAIELELSKRIGEYADSLSGREQLAVKAFAESLEMIPRTLAENAGLDPIDMLTALKARHDEGDKWVGLNVFEGKPQDMWSAGIIEPLKIKEQAIQSATESTGLILRIDDVIESEKPRGSQGMPSMPPGGAMPPGNVPKMM